MMLSMPPKSRSQYEPDDLLHLDCVRNINTIEFYRVHVFSMRKQYLCNKRHLHFIWRLFLIHFGGVSVSFCSHKQKSVCCKRLLTCSHLFLLLMSFSRTIAYRISSFGWSLRKNAETEFKLNTVNNTMQYTQFESNAITKSWHALRFMLRDLFLYRKRQITRQMKNGMTNSKNREQVYPNMDGIRFGRNAFSGAFSLKQHNTFISTRYTHTHIYSRSTFRSSVSVISVVVFSTHACTHVISCRFFPLSQLFVFFFFLEHARSCNLLFTSNHK